MLKELRLRTYREGPNFFIFPKAYVSNMSNMSTKTVQLHATGR